MLIVPWFAYYDPRFSQAQKGDVGDLKLSLIVFAPLFGWENKGENKTQY